MEIKVFDHVEDLTELVSLEIQKAAEEKEITLALSGGSTPVALFKHLSKNYKDEINWKNIKFFWGDERCVPPNNKESNYGTAYKTLLKNINLHEEQVFRIKGEDDPQEEAVRYSGIITNNVKPENGLPKFDIIMLGLGEDGHTASIFSKDMELINSDKICETAVHPETGQQRITITGRTINNAEKIFFLVTGKNKSEVLYNIFRKSGNYKNYPASFINPPNGKLSWFLDKEAASKLSL